VSGPEVSERSARKAGGGLRGWLARRRYRFVLPRVPLLTGARVLDIGGAEGVFAGILVGAGAARVTVVEPKDEHAADAVALHTDPRIRVIHDDIFARLELLSDVDLVTALHCIHQLGPEVHDLFRAIAASPVRAVVLQGSNSHRAWVEPEHQQELWGPVVGLPDGMRALLERHGFRAELHPHRRYPVAVGVR
jgi:SAM-dependent methyltransferase